MTQHYRAEVMVWTTDAEHALALVLTSLNSTQIAGDGDYNEWTEQAQPVASVYVTYLAEGQPEANAAGARAAQSLPWPAECVRVRELRPSSRLVASFRESTGC